MSIQLSKLLYHLYDTSIYSDTTITGLSLDSRTVKPGDLFFAYKGTSSDGRNYIDQAIAQGARAILAEVNSRYESFQSQRNVPIFPIHHLQQQIGPIAAEFYGNPSEKLKIVGITGTNGKTSCSHFIAQCLKFLNIPCGVIGTLGSGVYGNIKESGFTTPDPISLQATLADFVKQKIKNVAMEVSSHSLEQGRVNGIHYEIGVFTNLTRDHLDYHGTLEAYGAAKQKLFENGRSHYAVINADDEFGNKLISSLAGKNVLAFSTQKNISLPQSISLIQAQNIELQLKGMSADIITPWGEGKLRVPLLGDFNLSNVLAVVTALCLLKHPLKAVLGALQQLTSVPGRMETFGGKDQPLVIVDFAHTPDALLKTLSALKSHCHGKLYCVFGCGGDRDAGKRPLMAKIAEQFADQVILTDDNPRTEDPEQIFSDILKGFQNKDKIIVEHNRSKAIRDSIQSAKTADCVLIAGKGAETYQIIGQNKLPFSDAEVVKQTLNLSN